MAKTLREIVRELRSQGIPIVYRDRSDGSIIITSIGGVSYQGRGAAGNKAAREMLGEKLDPTLAHQMQRAFKDETGYGPTRKKDPIDEETLKLLRKAQREIRKARKSGIMSGTVTMKNVRLMIKEKGVEYTRRVLKDIINKAKNTMTDDERHWLAETYRQCSVMAFTSDDDPKSADDLNAIAEYIEYNSVTRPQGKALYATAYDYQEGKITAPTLVENAREILGIGSWSDA